MFLSFICTDFKKGRDGSSACGRVTTWTSLRSGLRNLREEPTRGARLRRRLHLKAQTHGSTAGVVWRCSKGREGGADRAKAQEQTPAPSHPAPVCPAHLAQDWAAADVHGIRAGRDTHSWTHRAGRQRRLDGRARARHSRRRDPSPRPLNATDASSATRRRTGAERASGRLGGRASLSSAPNRLSNQATSCDVPSNQTLPPRRALRPLSPPPQSGPALRKGAIKSLILIHFGD